MVKTMSGKNDWNPFQKYPTNMLQLIIDYRQGLKDDASPLDQKALLNKHKELLETDVGVDKMFAAVGMAGNSTMLR